MARAEVEAALHAGAVFLLPTGSVEQHGPHLPFGNDHLAAWSLACAVAERLDGVCVPFSPLGVTPLHAGFGGTVSLQASTFTALLTDVIDSLAANGARRFAVVNWHEGNTAAIQVALQDLTSRGHASGLRTVLAQACYVAQELFGAEAGGLTHGGEIEVYPVLHAEPSWVRTDRVTESDGREREAERMDALRRAANVQPTLWDVRQISPAGWYGEPKRATPEKAERFMTTMAAALAERIQAAFAVVP